MIEVTQDIFLELETRGIECVILHHFDFEEGGDIDFCASEGNLEAFLGGLRAVLSGEGWQILQVFEHELSAAYIVCADMTEGGRFLLLDYCYDYRIRGHCILKNEEMLSSAQTLPWGGMGCEGSVELAYRFAKGAAKGKDSEKITEDLKELYIGHEEKFAGWLSERWSLELGSWTERKVGSTLGHLAECLQKQSWSLDEVTLKARRLKRPRGLWLECPDELVGKIDKELGLCFRKVRRAQTPGASLKSVMGSTLVIERTGRTPSWKRRGLQIMNCWLQASSVEDVIQFLGERNARYSKWK